MLIKCRECGLQVSNLAVFCPHCGCPVTNEEEKSGKKKKHRTKKGSARRRLPNGFGQISEIKNRNLRNPYRVMVTVGKTDNGRPICRLLKPQTYMNLSGESIRAALDYYKADETSELIVVYDDISLPPGQLRIRKKGSAGGHNGIKNIIAHLGHDTFMRIKVGVGEKPQGYDLAAYVLGHFDKKDREVMQQAFADAADAVVMMMNDSADAAMNHFNGKKQG